MTGQPRIAVIDYGAGNLVSIEQALTTVGASVTFAVDAEGLIGCDAVVVPGVGASAPAMERLDQQGLTGPLRGWLAADRPFLGICLGMQLLFASSDEDGAETLGAMSGTTSRLTDAPTLPHIGWNQVVRLREHPVFAGIADGADLYFVHSYAGVLADGPDAGAALATTTHGGTFVSAVARGTLVGVQFHPERSGTDGLRLLGNFVDLVRAA
jgi:imidazole glycerol phosphate synthase glutamine amidotransferase subunit